MAGSMKGIRSHIKSVESTLQITRAMEVVASSKLRRETERIERSRPYFKAMYETLLDLVANDTEIQSAYTGHRTVKKCCYVVMAGDRGLAGGFNSNIFRLYEEQHELHPNREFCVLPIGKQSEEYFSTRGDEVISHEFAIAEDLTISDCFEISRMLCAEFAKVDVDEIRIIYTQFVSALVQRTAILSVLPFDAVAEQARIFEEGGEERATFTPSDTWYEPSRLEVFDAIVPEYVAGLVYGTLCESQAAEQAARSTAMDSATKNAEEMIDSLSLQYNRARQDAITQELTEIIAGSESS